MELLQLEEEWASNGGADWERRSRKFDSVRKVLKRDNAKYVIRHAGEGHSLEVPFFYGLCYNGSRSGGTN
ncbi:hypothetical protein [Effusibacillus lacus]|uniref:hypothetical protein n=1 Tax=Effusibacillus lacus TaxID=1348429 RepID=UPI000BB78380|nr:hypothetical protein [Effusibacillus lacus]